MQGLSERKWRAPRHFRPPILAANSGGHTNVELGFAREIRDVAALAT